MRTLIIHCIAVLSLAWASVVNATPITYDYSFDTPSFDDPPFGPVNTILAALGPTISGTISFDTDNAISTGSDGYFYQIFMHSGDLDDSLGWDELPGAIHTSGGKTALSAIGDWVTPGDEPEFRFSMTWEGGLMFALAECTDLAAQKACGGEGYVSEQQTLRGASVPLPSTIALLALGLLAMRRRIAG